MTTQTPEGSRQPHQRHHGQPFFRPITPGSALPQKSNSCVVRSTEDGLVAAVTEPIDSLAEAEVAVATMSLSGNPLLCGKPRHPDSTANRNLYPCDDAAAPIPADPPGECLDDATEPTSALLVEEELSRPREQSEFALRATNEDEGESEEASGEKGGSGSSSTEPPKPSPSRDLVIVDTAPRPTSCNAVRATPSQDGGSASSGSHHHVNRILEALALFPAEAGEATAVEGETHRRHQNQGLEQLCPEADAPPALVIVRSGEDDEEEEARRTGGKAESSSDSSISSSSSSCSSSPPRRPSNRVAGSSRPTKGDLRRTSNAEKREDSSTAPVSDSEGASNDRELSHRDLEMEEDMVDEEQEEGTPRRELTSDTTPSSRDSFSSTEEEEEEEGDSVCRDRDCPSSAANEPVLDLSALVRRVDRESGRRDHRRQTSLADEEELDALVRELDGGDDVDGPDSTHLIASVVSVGGRRVHHRRRRSGRRASRRRRSKSGAGRARSKKGQGRTNRTVLVRYADPNREASETSVSDYSSDDDFDRVDASAFPQDPMVQALLRMMPPGLVADEVAESSGESSLEETRARRIPSNQGESPGLTQNEPEEEPPREEASALQELLRDVWKSCTCDPFYNGEPQSSLQPRDLQHDLLQDKAQEQTKEQLTPISKHHLKKESAVRLNDSEQLEETEPEGENLKLLDFIDASFFYELWKVASLQLCDVTSSNAAATNVGQSHSAPPEKLAAKLTNPSESVSFDPSELTSKEATGPFEGSATADHPKLLAECLSRGGGGSPLAQRQAALILEQCEKRFPSLYQRIIGRLDARSAGVKSDRSRRKRDKLAKPMRGSLPGDSDDSLFSEQTADGRTNPDLENKTPRIRNTSYQPFLPPQSGGDELVSAGFGEDFAVDLFDSTHPDCTAKEISEDLTTAIITPDSRMRITVSPVMDLPRTFRPTPSEPFHLRRTAVDMTATLGDGYPFLSPSNDHPHPSHDLEYDFHNEQEEANPVSVLDPSVPDPTTTKEISTLGQPDSSRILAGFEQGSDITESEPESAVSRALFYAIVPGNAFDSEPEEQLCTFQPDLPEESIEIEIDQILSDLESTDKEKRSNCERSADAIGSWSVNENVAGSQSHSSSRRYHSVPRLRGCDILSDGMVQEREVTLETPRIGDAGIAFDQVEFQGRAPKEEKGKRRPIWKQIRPSQLLERSISEASDNRLDSCKIANAECNSVPSARRVFEAVDSRTNQRNVDCLLPSLQDETLRVSESGRNSPSSFPSLFQQQRDDSYAEPHRKTRYIPSDGLVDCQNVNNLDCAALFANDEASKTRPIPGVVKKRTLSPSRMRRSSSLPNSAFPLPNRKVYDLSGTSWVKLSTPTRPFSIDESHRVAVSERVAWWDKVPSPPVLPLRLPSIGKKETEDRALKLGTQSEMSRKQKKKYLMDTDTSNPARHDRKLQGSPPRFQRLNSRNARRDDMPLLKGEPLQ